MSKEELATNINSYNYENPEIKIEFSGFALSSTDEEIIQFFEA